MDNFLNWYIKSTSQALQNKRLFVVIGFFSGTVAILSFFSSAFLYDLSKLLNIELRESGFSLVALLIALFSFALLYLQSGGVKGNKDYDENLKFKLDREFINQRKGLENHFVEIEKLKRQIELLQTDKGLSEDDRKNVINETINNISEESIKNIFKSEASNYKEVLEKKLGYDKLKESVQEIKYRLQREITDLRLRANINLLLGMVITAGGLYLLWTTVSMVDTSKLLKELASEGTESNGKFLKNLLLPLVPRVMLVIFVEVFAYFFLRLYKEGLSEIKYFQNELTNVESKLVALEFSYVTGNEGAMNKVIESLSVTERNFVLEKNQTTVELEKAKSDTQMTQTLIKAVPNLFKKS
ncbi:MULTISPECIES: hypothetical protein [Pseudoalteromonas]|uniref:hypothetical protein n=1 Tax=Pseudoalteromonas TaxID=53246 RepID=UPI0018E3DE8B|nr:MULTISPECIES: hypothetical protein [Pseudoalteromonas]